MRHRDEPEDLNERAPVDPKAMREALALTSAPVKAPPPPNVYHRPEPAPCVVCGELASILHALPEAHRRTVCAACQGRAARDRLRALAEACRTMRTSDDGGAIKSAIATIERLDNFARETIAAIQGARHAAEAKAEIKPRKGFQ